MSLCVKVICRWTRWTCDSLTDHLSVLFVKKIIWWTGYCQTLGSPVSMLSENEPMSTGRWGPLSACIAGARVADLWGPHCEPKSRWPRGQHEGAQGQGDLHPDPPQRPLLRLCQHWWLHHHLGSWVSWWWDPHSYGTPWPYFARFRAVSYTHLTLPTMAVV